MAPRNQSGGEMRGETVPALVRVMEGGIVTIAIEIVEEEEVVTEDLEVDLGIAEVIEIAEMVPIPLPATKAVVILILVEIQTIDILLPRMGEEMARWGVREELRGIGDRDLDLVTGAR